MIKAIDVHGHFGPVGGFPQKEKEKELMSFTLEELEKSYQAAEIERAFVSPADGIFPFGERTLGAANDIASRYHAIVETHSGDDLSPPEAFTVYGDRYPEVKILLSHLGNNCDGDVTHHVRAIQNCKNGNLFTDTSSIKSIVPGLIEWAVSEIGSEHILLGTDIPLHHAGMMRSRVDYADLQMSDKENILYKNAEKIFFH